MYSLSISVTFVFPFCFSSLGWESLGLSASALKKGAFGRQCWDFGGLGYLHGYCCGKNHSSLTLKNVLVVSERVHFPWFFAYASIHPNEQILLRFLFQFMTYLKLFKVIIIFLWLGSLGLGTMRTISQVSCAHCWTGTSKRYRLARENNSKLERLHLHQPQFGARSSVTARIRNQPVV